MAGLRAGDASTIGLRPGERNPMAPQCPLHLRRVCGVCVHFERRDPAAGIGSQGQCPKFGRTLRGNTSAAECEFWTRPHVEAQP